MNKFPVSVSVDEETVAVIQALVRSRKFRNRSHVVEEAIRRLGGEL